MARTHGYRLIFNKIARSYGFSIKKTRSYASQYKKTAAFRVKTNKGSYMIKPFIGSKSRLIQLSSYAVKLHKRGFHGMPTWLRSRSGKYWEQKGGKLFYLTDWIEGRKMSSNKEDLVKLGGMLARLHSVSRSLKLPRQPDSVTLRHRRNYYAFLKRLKKLRRKPTEAGTWFRHHGDLCIELSRDAIHLLGTSRIRSMLREECRHPSLVHGDVTVANTLKSKTRIYLIDWDLMKRGSSYYDLVVALTNTAGFEPSKMAAFLKGYEKVRPLRRREKKLISALYRIPREAWYVCQYAMNGRKYGPLLNVLNKTWNNRLIAINWIDTWSRQ